MTVQRLVIVESPNKVRKIAGFLGPGFRVAASFGHVADLPGRGDLAVRFVDGRVEPQYQALERASRAISELRRFAAQTKEVLLATDPDREGEAIAWHIARLLGIENRCQRIVFQAITAQAVAAGLAHPRPLNQSLIDAQQARRVLDRVVGWVVSPTLRRGCGNPQARSAGRVQSAALRLVCEREQAIAAHATMTFYTLDAEVELVDRPQSLLLRLESWKGEELAHRLDQRETAERSAAWCQRQQDWRVIERQQRQQRRRPPPPFTTASVQQAASLRLRRNPKQTMADLQALFEAGMITYHRTDSCALAPEAIAAARSIIAQRFGQEMLPQEPVIHQSNSANTQEAHEAIRPTQPEQGPDAVEQDSLKGLYRLIWQRFIASQMIDGIDDVSMLRVGVGRWQDAQGQSTPVGVFAVRSSHQREAGWRRLGEDSTAEKKRKEADADTTPTHQHIPPCQSGDAVLCKHIRVVERSTKAPPRFTQAGLIKRLEKEGIGRPSTYASILSTLLDRGYVSEKRRCLHASPLGMQVTGYLLEHFSGDFIDLAYTARMESGLDAIARGEISWQAFVTQAAFALREAAQKAGLPYDPLAASTADQHKAPACPLCNAKMRPCQGPYGPFYACSDHRCPGTMKADGTISRKTLAILQERKGQTRPRRQSKH